ncbi:MAG TPA: GNAT family N-acetyltransferase [Nocardioides sp.]|nr:GNAT family N-acetyltransferase [Nocardioides sp.]
MSLTVQENAAGHRYEAVDESGVVAGFVEYVDHRGSRLLFHTEVDDAFEGRGVGSTLARESIEQALAAGAPVTVSCPFLKRWLGKHPEYDGRVTLR